MEGSRWDHGGITVGVAVAGIRHGGARRGGIGAERRIAVERRADRGGSRDPLCMASRLLSMLRSETSFARARVLEVCVLRIGCMFRSGVSHADEPKGLRLSISKRGVVDRNKSAGIQA